MIATVLVAPLLAMVASIPSEWGWRAYFYSRMAGRFGARAGALWAAIPVAALGVVAVKVTVPQGGISESQAMVAAALGAGLFSIIASYFYRRRKSIWAAALATGAIAAHANGVLTTIVTDPEPWIGAPSGAIFFGVFGVVAWKLWHADWTPVDDSTPVMEMEAAYEIPDGPAVPEPMESAPPEKTEEEPDDSPGGAG
ncbi:CPBP family intramembrane metalloprotease [bacterium]|nr:CPBP family intramembrane metalloprotease [bacterium]